MVKIQTQEGKYEKYFLAVENIDEIIEQAD